MEGQQPVANPEQMSSTSGKFMDKVLPGNSQDFLKKHAYSIIIVLLICIVVVMLFPSRAMLVIVGVVLSAATALAIQIFLKSDHFKKFGVQLSTLKRTLLLGAGAGLVGVSVGMCSARLIPVFENLIGFI